MKPSNKQMLLGSGVLGDAFMMVPDELVKSYQKLNKARPKSVVFQLTRRGFLSEINNMLLAMLYCLVYEMEFILFSRGWSSSCGNGWQDYFIPFCHEESNMLFYRRSAFRVVGRRERILESIQKLFFKHSVNAHDIWGLMTDKKFLNRRFIIPELGIDGDVFHAKQVLWRMVYRYNAEVCDKITTYDDLLYKISPFVGVHIRRGDKVKETDLIPVRRYVEQVLQTDLDVKHVFIATDDGQAVNEFKSLCPDSWLITSLCHSGNDGYSQSLFNQQGSLEKKRQTIAFLRDLYFLGKSEYFIGTYSSNIARTVALLIGRERCYSLDTLFWPAD